MDIALYMYNCTAMYLSYEKTLSLFRFTSSDKGLYLLINPKLCLEKWKVEVCII